MSLRRITLKDGADLSGFRRAVRMLAAEELAPQHVVFALTDSPDLFGGEAAREAPPVSLPRRVGELVEGVVCHSDPERYALLYQLVWRVLNGERELLDIASDPLVHRLTLMARAIRRDLHKMHAFVRFRQVETEGGERLRILVRARAPHPGGRRALFRRALRLAPLVDPDAEGLRPLGPAGAHLRPARAARGCA
jgi:DNA polymerase